MTMHLQHKLNFVGKRKTIKTYLTNKCDLHCFRKFAHRFNFGLSYVKINLNILS